MGKSSVTRTGVSRTEGVDLHSSPHLRSWAVRVNERMKLQIQEAEIRIDGLRLKDRVRSSDIRRELRVEPLLLLMTRSQRRWFWVSDQGTSWVLSFGGFLGMTSWEESPRQTQNLLEGLYISSGPGIAWDPPGGAGGVAGESGRLGYLSLLTLDKQDGNGWITLKLFSG